MIRMFAYGEDFLSSNKIQSAISDDSPGAFLFEIRDVGAFPENRAAFTTHSERHELRHRYRHHRRQQINRKSLIERYGKADQIVPTKLQGLVRRLDRADNLRSTMTEIILADYNDSASLCAAMEGADCIIHLAGALIPRPGETLLEANAQLTESIVEAAQNVEVGNIVCLSYPGADPSAKNLYLRSKGLAEKPSKTPGSVASSFGPHDPWTGKRDNLSDSPPGDEVLPPARGRGSGAASAHFSIRCILGHRMGRLRRPRFSAEIRPLGDGNDIPRRTRPAGCGPLGPKVQNHFPSQARSPARGLARRLSLFREYLQQDDLRHPVHRAPWRPVSRQDIPALFPDAPGRNARPHLPEHRLKLKENSPILLCRAGAPNPQNALTPRRRER